MKVNIKTSIPDLSKLNRYAASVNKRGEDWVKRNSKFFYETARERLRTQGRGGNGTPPPLAQSTIERYNRYGWPDGSALYDHIQYCAINKHHAVVGITKGKPSMIAAVQNDGAIINTQSGKTFYIPGRRFWDTAKQQTKTKIKSLPGR